MSSAVHIRATLRDWKKVSAFTPSSTYVVRRLCAAIDFSSVRTIAEYGPGNGVVTRSLLEAMRPESRLIGIELNQSFADHLRVDIADSRFRVYHDTAENAEAVLNRAGVSQLDCIVSGIPFFWLPPHVRERIVASAERLLRPGGKFVALQMCYVTRGVLCDYLRRYFVNVDTCIEWRNLPPLRILVGEKRVAFCGTDS